MNKEFIPYELAVKLRELGFDEECFGYSYRDTPDPKSSLNIYFAKQPINNSSLKEDKGIALPLWQQAFEWLRIKHNLHYGIRNDGTNNCWYFSRWGKRYKTYEEARLECINFLLDLISNKT